MKTFWSLLGTVAGGLALTFGARGGVYVAGAIARGEVAGLHGSAFRRRFEDKGRFRDYLKPIPTRVIVHEAPALLGARAMLSASQRLP